MNIYGHLHIKYITLSETVPLCSIHHRCPWIQNNPHDRTDRQRTTRVTTIYTKLPPQPPQYPSECPESQSAHNRSVNFWQSDPYSYYFLKIFTVKYSHTEKTGPLWKSGETAEFFTAFAQDVSASPRSSTFAMQDLSDAAWDSHGILDGLMVHFGPGPKGVNQCKEYICARFWRINISYIIYQYGFDQY